MLILAYLERAIAPAKHEGGVVVRTILSTALLTITPLLVYEQERVVTRFAQCKTSLCPSRHIY